MLATGNGVPAVPVGAGKTGEAPSAPLPTRWLMAVGNASPRKLGTVSKRWRISGARPSSSALRLEERPRTAWLRVKSSVAAAVTALAWR